MPQIIFLTVYLGLIAGRQPIELQASADVKLMRILVDGAKVVTLGAPPWKTIVDLGPAPLPREIAAVGFDDKGNEIARATQLINIPRPRAEVEIAVQHDKVTLTGRHVSYSEPTRATLTLDDAPLPLDRHFVAKLGNIDMKRPHVLSAEMHFADGAVGRREIVIGGQFGETMPAQLTAVAVPPGGCVDPALHVTSTEKPDAQLMVVRDPSPALYRALLLPDYIRQTRLIQKVATLASSTQMQAVWPVADRIAHPDQATAVIFPFSKAVDASTGGLLWLLTEVASGGESSGPRQWADAAAVAGVRAIEGGRRRAVLLVLSGHEDKSLYTPAAVHSYLDAIGVPLFVWSVSGPRNDLAATWGKVDDVSSPHKLQAATDEIKRTLDAQRIAWVEGDPLAAMRGVRSHCTP